MIPWIVKYAPNTLNDVIGQSKSIEKLKEHINNHPTTKKPILIYGVIGSGKTSSVVSFANDYSYELVELNASDTRNAKSISEFLEGVVNQSSLFGTNKIILIDELDGLSGVKDRGALQTLIKYIAISKYPFVLICEDAYENKLKPLRKISEVIEFKPRSVDDVFSVFKNICIKENIKYSETALYQLARMSGGDLRAGINDLQVISSKGSIHDDDLVTLDTRDNVEEIEKALFKIFKTLKVEVALTSFDNVSEDLDKIFLWVEENIPSEYLSPESLKEAFDNLSIANVFHGRIRRWQYYRFYVYCYNLLSAGIALSKTEKNPTKIKYVPSSRLLKIWIFNNSVAKRKSIAQKVGAFTYTAQKKSFSNVIPYLQIIFNESKEIKPIIDELDLSNEEVEWLKRKS